MFLGKELIDLEIKTGNSFDKRKVNDMEASSSNTQDSNCLKSENDELKPSLKTKSRKTWIGYW